MQTIKLGDLAEVENDLRALLDLQCKAALGFKLLKVAKPLINILDDYNEARQKLFDRLGEPIDDKPGMLAIPGKNVEEFQAEITELISQDIEVVLPIISMEELETGVTGDIQPLMIHRLERFIQ